MIINDLREQSGGKNTKQECFLCAIDPYPCSIRQLEGHIIAAYEFNANGEITPFITLHVGGAELASLSLTRYYCSLVRGLRELGDDMHKRKLTLRVYHLPPATNVTEHKGRKIYRYRANSYTLAVLEPDTLLNITDLNAAEYCPRQYLLNRLVSFSQSAPIIRGNLVHHAFKELLKEHDRGELMTDHNRYEPPLATLHRHFEQELERSSIELALAHISPEAMRAEVAPHLESLATWYTNQRSSLWDMPTGCSTEHLQEQQSENLVRAETFLLAPEIGLRGRLDLLWRQSGQQRLLELKTGGAKGELPQSSHRWQVRGYHALLTVRRDSKMKKALATLLYSGTPGEAEAFGIPFTVKELQRVNETRNILALSHVTGIPPAPPSSSRCTKCSMLNACQQVSFLLKWQPPERDSNEDAKVGDIGAETHLSSQDRDFFARYYNLLQLEGREGEKQQALLWQESVEERVKRGVAIKDLKPLGKPEPTGQGEWRQTFSCINESELRDGDEILLSDENPITGEVVTGNIVSISANQATVWIPELINSPTRIDRYENNIVHVRTLQNLQRWLKADSRLRGLVAGSLRTQFRNRTFLPRADFNVEQNLAVERAMQMEDYLLIHGPPGTGKTSVIAEIVKRLCQEGQRVLLAAFTNQAVDNMLIRLEKEGFKNYVRLGHERNVDEAVQSHLLKRLVEQKHDGDTAQDKMEAVDADALPQHTPTVREVLRERPVVASTTATWSSATYTPSSFNESEDNQNSVLQFDVAIIDEAGQLTVPAILGALRLAKRFILVGDEKQLPPLVLSKEAIQQGLADSLFSILKRLDLDYTKDHPEAISACVALQVQYRMNLPICTFASKNFYENKLMPHPSIAERILEVPSGKRWAGSEARAITRALDPTTPMVFLDVQSVHREQGGPKTSSAEACTVGELLAGLLMRGIAPKDIGIIAPYRAQVAQLRRQLLSEVEHFHRQNFEEIDFSELSIDTVDRFQGGERKVIIISFATMHTPEVESQLREHLTNPNRLNVALTRAQQKLILVGCAPALTELPIFQALLIHCQEKQTVIVHSPASTTRW